MKLFKKSKNENKANKNEEQFNKRLKEREKTQSDSLFEKAISLYYKYRDELPINDKELVVTSYGSRSIMGSPYYIIKELHENPYYSDFKITVISTWKEYAEVESFCKRFSKIKVVKIHTDECCRALARAKYLLTNTTFSTYVIKREGQVMLNTWHGTPLKALGRAIKNSPDEIGNTMRNFLMSDYLLYPNDFTFEHMSEDYMLKKYYNGKYIISGYPRNSIFLNKDESVRVRSELGISDKRVIAFMPTWRGALGKFGSSRQAAYTLYALYEIDKKLDDNTVMYVKLHALNNMTIDYEDFEHIKPFPAEYETYEILNASDCLVTDYSSVMFDFANTGKKIVLYGFDKEQYLNDKGMYIDYDSLPFVFVDTYEKLYDEIMHVDSYEPYGDKIADFIKYDSVDATKKLCDLFFKGESQELKIIDAKQFHNGKKTILVFGGSLAKNGMTSALKAFIANIDKDKYNVLLTFNRSAVFKNNSQQTINEFSDIDYLPIQSTIGYTDEEFDALLQREVMGNESKQIDDLIKKANKREAQRCFVDVDFDYAVHYSGYECVALSMFSYMDCKKIIFIHSDFKQEADTKSNIDVQIHQNSLLRYDLIACVRDTSRQEVKSFFPKLDEKKIVVSHNFIAKDKIIQMSDYDIEFNSDTMSNVSVNELNDILNNDKVQKILNIGRFSYEKGLDRIVLAFADYRKNYCKDSYLLLVGGYGDEYDNINKLIKDNNVENVVVIKSINNPFPILKKSDVFILSSRYEALPMTILEALTLRVPIVTTDIIGPALLLENKYGTIVDNSQQGILDGMIKFNNNELANEVFDVDEFNRIAKQELDSLFN